MLIEQFGERLKYWREKRGWSKSELARRADISCRAVWGYERGNLNPTLYAVERILSALGISIAKFFEEVTS